MAETKGFDLASVLGQVSKLDTGREQIEYIKIALLKSDPNNFYALDGVDELARNIELVGLQQPLRVRPDESDPGFYVLVSGHRRKAALKQLVDEGHTELTDVPCIVERSDGSDALRELRLIYANSDTRRMSSADISKQAERVEMLLYQLKEEGYEFPGKMRDHVAEACKISASKLARLKVIREKLVPPNYVEMWAGGRMTEQVAYAIARMPAMMQEAIAKARPSKPPAADVVAEMQGLGMDHYLGRTQSCPDGECCTNGARILSHDAHAAGSWDVGRCKCCATCRDNRTCAYACPAGKAEGAKKKDAEAAEKKKAEVLRQNEADARIAAMTPFIRRLAAAAETTSRLRKAAHGTHSMCFRYDLLYRAAFDGEPVRDTRCYYIPDADDLAVVCRNLGVSADWLLGLSEGKCYLDGGPSAHE